MKRELMLAVASDMDAVGAQISSKTSGQVKEAVKRQVK